MKSVHYITCTRCGVARHPNNYYSNRPKTVCQPCQVARARRWKENHSQELKYYKKERVDALADTYIRSLLRAGRGSVPEELMNAKREQIQVHRALAEVKRVIKDKTGD